MPDETKEVLCFGDSNTWGYDPHTQERYPRDARWVTVLARELGKGWHVIPEGCNGRTTVWDDPIEGDKNGLAYLRPCLVSHMPLDLVVIMLGTNDLKRRFSVGAFDIANGAGRLVEAVQKSDAGRGGAPPAVLLIAPPPTTTLTDFAEMFDGARAKSLDFGKQFARVAQERGCAFLDAGTAIASSEADGIHLDSEAHETLGRAVAEHLRRLV